MFSPVKAIIAGALVFALGGAFLIAQPFDQQGSVPGAEQGADPAAPVEVTGKRVDRVCSVSAGTGSGLGVEGRQMTCEMSHEWSDPRLDGTATYISNEVEYTDDSNLVIGQYVQNIVNDDGAWRMRPQFRFHSAGPGPENFSGTWVLDGEGAYEGLVAVLDKSEGGTLHGFIIEGDVPSAPAEASTK